MKRGFSISDYENLLEAWEEAITPCYSSENKNPADLDNPRDLQLLSAFKEAYKDLLVFKKDHV